jgi:hypothetical protein
LNDAAGLDMKNYLEGIQPKMIIFNMITNPEQEAALNIFYR